MKAPEIHEIPLEFEPVEIIEIKQEGILALLKPEAFEFNP